jgi:hypothetical protein
MGDSMESHLVEPDGLFGLRFNDRPTDQQQSDFFYEAESWHHELIGVCLKSCGLPITEEATEEHGCLWQ